MNKVIVSITTEDGEVIDRFGLLHYRTNNDGDDSDCEYYGSVLANLQLQHRIEQATKFANRK